jgi:hypothetical protein
MIGKKFEVRSGIRFNLSDDKRSLKPNVNLQKLQLFPTVESVIAEQFGSALPDLKIIEVEYLTSSIRLGISYYFSPLDTQVVSEIVIDKKNGLKVNFDFEEFIQQQVCNNIKNYITDNPQLISNIYQDLQLSSHPICTSGLLTVPISVAIGQIEVPGAVLVPMDGLPSLKLYLDDLLNFGNVLKELLGSINIGGTEFRTPYYSVEKGNVSLYLHSAIELDVIPGFGNISADYTISNKGLKLNGDIEVRSDMWFDIIPPYLSVGEFGIGLNPTDKSLSFLGAATISPGDAVSGIAKFNGKATLPLDPSNLYFKMEGELLMPGNTKLAHGNACLGKASDCKVTDIAPNKHLLDININMAIPGLKFISLDGNLRMQDDKEEFVKIGASGRLLGVELAKVLLTMSKELRGKLVAEIDLKIVDFEATAKTSPALVPSALSFNGELKGVAKFSGMADKDVGVSAAIEPQGALKYVMPSFSITVPSFSDLFNILGRLELAIELGRLNQVNLSFAENFVDENSNNNLKGEELDKGSFEGGKNNQKVNLPDQEKTPNNLLGLTVYQISAEHCRYKIGDTCDGPIRGSIGDKKICLGKMVPVKRSGLRIKDDLISQYFNIPRGQSTCRSPSEFDGFEHLRIIEQNNKYRTSRNGVPNGVHIFVNQKDKIFNLTHSKSNFNFPDYEYAVVTVHPEKKFVVIRDEQSTWYLLPNQPIPSDSSFTHLSDKQKIPTLKSKPFSKAHIEDISNKKEKLFYQIVETIIKGHEVNNLAVNEHHAIFKVKNNTANHYYWSYFVKESPRSFEVISPTDSSQEMNSLFATLNKLPEEYEIGQNCGYEQVSINNSPCGLVIFTKNTALILNTASNNNHKPAWVVHKDKVVSGSWQPSALLLEKLGTDSHYLLNQIRSDDTWQGYLDQAIHDKITSDFTLVIGRSECSLKMNLSECKASELNKKTRIGLKYKSGTDINLEVFHSKKYCLKATNADVDDFWKQNNINLERIKSMNSKGSIDNELMLEAIVDETWMKSSQNGIWQANPIGVFEQGELKNNERGCKL